jgi:hypothetical protein
MTPTFFAFDDVTVMIVVLLAVLALVVYAITPRSRQ